jgi:phosphoenolpyruvate phosphomutase
MKKTTRLKELLNQPGLAFICEAHNGLSAKIVEETGFDGIWGSGLTMSAAMGVRDNNEASWTQVLDVLEFMTDATTIPILLDGDTGYGNFNNMRRLVNKLEQRDVAGVCIEDKLFPKTNSFIKGEQQPLADIDEFCGKIKAGKDTQRDSDFCIVARTEAFIAGWGLGEALKRAEAYYKAGADAILCHSKKATPSDVLSFMKEWDYPCPVVIVPTMYYATPPEVFEKAGVSLLIFANHLLRSSIRAMQETAQQLFADKSLHRIEEEVAAVREIFRLQGASELSDAEKRYLPKRRNTRAVVLAASKGARLGELTEDRPKCMVPIQGEPVLKTLIGRFNGQGIKDVNVVTGYKPEAIRELGIRTFQNDAWDKTGELGSLLTALEVLDGETVLAYGDVVFQNYVLANLLRSTAPITIVVDSSKKNFGSHKQLDLVRASEPHEPSYVDRSYRLSRIDPFMSDAEAHGEWIGLVKLGDDGVTVFKNAIEQLKAEDAGYAGRSIAEVLNVIVKAGREVAVQYTHGDWLDLDDLQDLVKR